MPASSEISKIPFARILPWIIGGILLGNALPHIRWYIPALAAVVCAAVAWLWRVRKAAWIYTGCTLLFYSFTLTLITLTREVMPHGDRLVMTVRVDSEPVEMGRWLRADARVDKFRAYETYGERSRLWESSGEKVVIRFDTAARISAGNRLIVTARAGDLGTEDYAGYVRLMRRRGYSASVWVNSWDEVRKLPGSARTPKITAARLQAVASERLSGLDIPPVALDVARAMTVGDRAGFDPELRTSYSLTGASHLLAVSGLHVGIVAVLVNLLLSLLPTARRGHIVRNIVAILAIWAYAFVTGLSPSVLRAAMMFTGAQLALASSRQSAGLNVMLGTAAVMLLLNPNYLYDVSFQLSFAAVLGIFMFFGPLYGLVRTRLRALNLLWSLFIVGFVATLMTAPLVSYYFGRIPIIGLFINPVVVFAAHVTVLFSLVWIVMPAGFLSGVFSAVIGFSAGLQNRVVEFSASKSWASAEIQLGGWQVGAVYVVIFVVWYLIRSGYFAKGEGENKVDRPGRSNP